MADEDDDKQDKTEDPTPRRRQEAREQGQVALSSEVISAAMLCAGMGVLVVGGGALAQACGVLLTGSLGSLATNGRLVLEPQDCASLIGGSLRSVVLPTCAIVVPMWLVALLAGYVQIGFQVTPKAVSLDFGRLDPTKGIGRLFSLRAAVRTLFALVKVIAIVVTMCLMAWKELPGIAALQGGELGPQLAGLGQVALRCTGSALIAITAVALFDFGWQRWHLERDLRMTRRELRDEARSTEGDPHLKARVRQIQREMAQRRMMQDVPTATVVVTNPTHYAVALRYERDATGKKRSAPRVVAKGVDLVAQRIKDVAREHGVALYEDVPLARALHAQCEIGDEIPSTLYQAVASVLAYVYRLPRGRAREAVRA